MIDNNHADETATPKTVAEQQQHTAEAAPQITLDTTPKTAAEVIAKANDGKCHAHRFQQGVYLSCTKKRGHDGHHKDGKRGWRASSGDAAEDGAMNETREVRELSADELTTVSRFGIHDLDIEADRYDRRTESGADVQ